MKIKEIREIHDATRIHPWLTEYFLGGFSIVLSSYLRTRLLQGTLLAFYVPDASFRAKVKWNFPDSEVLL